MRLWAFALLPAAAVVLAGCGGSSHPTAAASATTKLSSSSAGAAGNGAAKLPGFLATANNGAIFLQWQRQGDAVTGKLSESYYDPSNPTELQPEVDNFTGTITGSQISLTLGSGTTWSGTISGSSMTLSYTDPSDGSIQTLDFRPANAAQYNAAVEATKAKVAGAVSRQQHQQAVSNAKQQVDDDANSLSSDMQSLNSDPSSLAGDGFASDLATSRSDVQTAYQDLQTALSDSADEVCSDADTVSSDADTVVSDQDTIASDVDTAQSDIQTAMQDIASVRADEQKLAADNAVVPSYSPANAPTAVDVAAAVRAAHGAIAKARQAIKSAQEQAAHLVAQANGYANQAQADCTKRGA